MQYRVDQVSQPFICHRRQESDILLFIKEINNEITF
jgi:hypothetical protein